MQVPSLVKGLFNFLISDGKRHTIRTKVAKAKQFLSKKKSGFTQLLSSQGPVKKYTSQYSLKLSLSRKVSRISGKFAHLPIPKVLRKAFYTLYAKFYHVNLEEIENSLDSFESFSKFFTRTIKPRPIDSRPLSVASPADSRVLTFSEVKGDEVLIVKGIEYKLGEFLTGVKSYQLSQETLASMKRNPQNRLYQIILYLAPGDYHRFHAPADCAFKSRNHIVGKLKPVQVKYVKTHSGVYQRNERVNLFGDWVKGFMCMVFVGALNVGSIDLNFDSSLQTNRKLKLPFTNTHVKVYTEDEDVKDLDSKELPSVKNISSKGITVNKGEEIGKFNLGSTIVLVFEASPDFEWTVEPGQAVKYGQCIGISK